MQLVLCVLRTLGLITAVYCLIPHWKRRGPFQSCPKSGSLLCREHAAVLFLMHATSNTQTIQRIKHLVQSSHRKNRQKGNNLTLYIVQHIYIFRSTLTQEKWPNMSKLVKSSGQNAPLLKCSWWRLKSRAEWTKTASVRRAQCGIAVMHVHTQTCCDSSGKPLRKHSIDNLFLSLKKPLSFTNLFYFLLQEPLIDSFVAFSQRASDCTCTCMIAQSCRTKLLTKALN